MTRSALQMQQHKAEVFEERGLRDVSSEGISCSKLLQFTDFLRPMRMTTYGADRFPPVLEVFQPRLKDCAPAIRLRPRALRPSLFFRIFASLKEQAI